MIKVFIFVASLVPAVATIVENAEQAWSAATGTDDKVKVVIAALEDLLTRLRELV